MTGILPLGAFLLPLRRMIDGPGDLHILATMFTRTPPPLSTTTRTYKPVHTHKPPVRVPLGYESFPRYLDFIIESSFTQQPC